MTNGERIIIERRRKGLTQGEVARRAGITQQTLCDIERNNVEITEATLLQILATMQEKIPA